VYLLNVVKKRKTAAKNLKRASGAKNVRAGSEFTLNSRMRFLADAK
jgi:hypothetical protein